ncbi:transcriptional regulator [Paenibacillus sp. 598K]|uniref:winged helix-turn-helix transcriptional regulator n=1 Tax=Paenibacillus sp. 598K TaxID=1117987 RepID=UPI000FFA2375|nr:winged helix-turn-helix transcriptional regulator [Paenibacillus sp. 598K]GBF75809.1 transcriptional regulator [Paenibacillus sp. 598K]
MEKKAEHCKIVVALDTIVGKWKPIILMQLVFGGTKRFNELRRLMPDITQRMLTLQLRELEEQDLVKRVIYPQVPPKVEYSLTEYGRTIIPLLDSMHEWGANHLEHMEKRNQQLTTERVSE